MPRLAAVLVLIALAAVGPSSSAGAEETAGFLAGTEDVPLMPGLRNDESTLVVFDKPEGRIVEVVARGKLGRTQVEKFYAAALPPLGWVPDGKLAWRREGERLHLDFKGRDGDLKVGFSLAPR